MAVTLHGRLDFIKAHLPPNVSMHIDPVDKNLIFQLSSGYRMRCPQDMIEDFMLGALEGFINRIWVSEGLHPLFAKGSPLGMGSTSFPTFNDTDIKLTRAWTDKAKDNEDFIDWLVKEKDDKDG